MVSRARRNTTARVNSLDGNFPFGYGYGYRSSPSSSRSFGRRQCTAKVRGDETREMAKCTSLWHVRFNCSCGLLTDSIETSHPPPAASCSSLPLPFLFLSAFLAFLDLLPSKRSGCLVPFRLLVAPLCGLLRRKGNDSTWLKLPVENLLIRHSLRLFRFLQHLFRCFQEAARKLQLV